ncbi:MAG TPA: hypothetical protein G4O02_14745 [Caldilineae bacterium]|nr:hypothetical protein [Caldilineae bacterium]
MAQAVAMIKARLGPHAVILHSRRIRRGVLRRSWLEVIAAVDEDGQPREGASKAVARPDGLDLRAMRAELSALRDVVTRLTWEVRRTRLPTMAPGLQMIYSHLLTRGLSEELATECVMAAAEELTPTAANDLEAVQACVARHLQSKIRTCVLFPREEKGNVVFLVGPTGVGKTTTLAKLAGRWTHEWHRTTALVSVDTYRAGAVSQLQAYGASMDIPVEVAYTPEEFAAIVQNYGDRDLILVDTAGRSPRDQAYLEELRDFMAVVEARQVYLVIAGSTAYADMENAVQRFAALSLDGPIVTKVDETDRLGAGVSLSSHKGLPIAYVTTGQRIPEDIEPASARQLAHQIVQGTSEEILARVCDASGVGHGEPVAWQASTNITSGGALDLGM